MKPRISATVDQRTIEILKRLVKKKRFRNYSHAIEAGVEILEKVEGEEKK